MSLLHFILDLAALLLWINWRAKPYDALATATPATLVGTLRRAEARPAKRWHFLLALLGLLLLRAGLYRILGPAVNWTAQLNLTATSLAFSSNFLDRMLAFSLLSFVVTLGVFFLWLLLLSLLAGGAREGFPFFRLARAYLGSVDGWPGWLKSLLPLTVTGSGWWLLTWALTAGKLMPAPATELARLGQAGLVGLGSYLSVKVMVITLLGLHLLHNHVYFGNQALWLFVDHCAKRLLLPLRPLPLRLARVDFAPVAGIVGVIVLTHVAEYGWRPPMKLDANGRAVPPAYEIPGLVDYFRSISR